MNIYEIARAAKVSPATVSRVINGNEHVREEARARVTEVIEKSGFVPNFFARSLNQKQTNTVGILCPVISDINHARQVSVLEGYLRRDGFDIILCSLEQNYDNKRAYLELLIQKHVDAIFIIGTGNDELIGDIAAKVPIIVINGTIRIPEVYNLVSDERHMAFWLVDTLWQAGCRAIAYVYDSETCSGREKRAGYLEGMKNCGLSAEGLMCRVDESISMNDIQAASDAIEAFFKSAKIFPDAVMTADDILAAPAQKVILSMGMNMPVIGWNNSMYAQIASPSITSVDINMDSLCREAVGVLKKIMEGKDASSSIQVSCRLVERESFVMKKDLKEQEET